MNRDEEDIPSNEMTNNSTVEPEGEDGESFLVSGRAYWFAQRTGQSSDSASITRLADAIDLAQAIATDPRDTLVLESVDYPHDARRDGKLVTDRVILAFSADSHLLASEKIHSMDLSEYGTFGPSLIVEELPKPHATIAMTVSASDLPDLNIYKAAFLRWHDDGVGASIVEASKYFATDELLVGRITRPGRYQAVTLPRIIFLDQALNDPIMKLGSLLCSYLRSINLATQSTENLEDQLKTLRALHKSIAAAVNSSGINDYAVRTDKGADNGSAAAKLLRSLIELTPDAVMERENKTPSIEPPALNLWRSRRISADRWESIGPRAQEGFVGIGRVKQIDVHPYDGKIVIAAAAGGGVWRTDDEGKHWRPLMQDEPSLTMGAVAFAASNPDIMYAASGEDGGFHNPAWPGIGVYRGTQGGRYWIRASNVTSTRFSAIFVHPTLPHTVYVAGNKGLHKSVDGGQTWLRNPGFDSLYDGHITDVVMDYDTPANIYIGVYNVGVLRSQTAGQSVGGAPAFVPAQDLKLPKDVEAEWVKLAIGRKGEHRSKFIVAKLGPQGARIFTTTDGGDTWTERAPNIATGAHVDWASTIAVDPSNENKLLTGTDLADLRLSLDGGCTWQSLPETHADHQDIAFDQRDSKRIYSANDGGVFLSTTGGMTWRSASADLAISQVYDLDVSQSNPEIVVCGTQDTGIFYRDGLGIWRPPPYSGDVPQVAIDPSDSKIIYFAFPKAINLAIQIFRSTDGLQTPVLKPIPGHGLTGNSPWVTIIKLIPDRTCVDPLKDRKLFVCGTNHLFFSTDSGCNFEVVKDKNGCPFLFEGTITALEYAPSNPLILYLGTSEGFIYRTEDGGESGASWERLMRASLASPVSAISIASDDPKKTWIAFGGDGVTRTARPNELQLQRRSSFVLKSENGICFSDASGRLPNMRLPEIPISAIAAEVHDHDIAYVGTDVGVFRTSDGGDSWTAFQDGLPRSPVTELLLHRKDRILFAATMGRGVYRRKLE